jgi:hypothetical protein
MFVKRYLRDVDELGEMIDIIVYVSKYASETPSAEL